MEIRKLHESDELQDRAKKHKKNNKGLSFYCTLNPDAGNVEHNVAMFNHMNTPAESPSVNPCGPMAEAMNTDEVSHLFKLHVGDIVEYEGQEFTVDAIRNDPDHTELVPSMLKLGDDWVPEEWVALNFDYKLREDNGKMDSQIELNYTDLEVTIVTRPRRPSSYHFEYDRDEAQTVEETIDYEFAVPRSDIVDFIYENMTENDFADIDTATEAEVLEFINKNFDTLFAKYESMILDAYRDRAREDAEEHMNESLTKKELGEATCGVEKFVSSLGKDLHEAFLSKLIDNNTSEELLRLEALYEKYARAHDDMHTQKIVEKVRSAIASCAENTQPLAESVNEYVIMAVCSDGKKQYYNVSSAPHWVDKAKDATIFDDMDEARAVWFKLDKKSFKRVFIPNYDHEKMNEAVDIDKQYQLDILLDRIEEVMDWKLNKKCKTRTLGNNTYRVVHTSGNTSMIVRFDVSDPVKPLTFMIDKRGPFTARNESEAADIILRELQNKHSDSFDMFKNEGLSDRIRKNDLDYDDELDAYLASEGDTEVQFQDRETHTHEFRTKKNQWGRSYVDGQYNTQPKVASHTWGRVWKDGKLVKQSEGPKYQVRADIAKYLDSEGNLDESKIPDNWTKYRGAWMYPVYGGWEANLDGLHYEAETEDELKLKIDSAVRDGYTKDNKLAPLYRDTLPAYGGMLDEAWSPDYIDCPVCGDISFDAKRGRCTQCAYRESVEDDTDDLEHPDQEFDSAKTSINSTKLPAVYRMVKIPQGTTGVDFGGGSFDNAVEHIRDLGATLCVYDPYNRSAEHNREVIKTLKGNGGADWAINSNVLNVIKEPEARRAVLQNISKITKSGAPVYITVYEGRGDGKEGATKSGYQLNRRTQDYLAEIQEVFPDAVRKGKLIIAHNGRGHVNESNNAYSYKDYTIIDAGSGWKVKDASQKWVGNEFATDRDAEEFVDSLNESFLDSDDNYEYVASKSVLDSDGFYTDYTWYKNIDGVNVFVFGDNDIYKPADGYIDHEEEDDTAAQEWFDSYNGFEEDIVDENLDTSNDVFCVDDQLEWTDLSGVKFRALVTDVNDDVVVLDMMPVGGTPVTKTFELTCDSNGKECIIADMASDKSDAVYVYPPHEDLEESTASNKVVYPNGAPVTDIDLNRALDYMYGTDRNPEWTYTDAEMQRAIYYWMDKTDPHPSGKSYMSLQESYNIKFYQIFQAPSKPTENGKMIGQRDTLSAAIDFGEDRCGPGKFFIKGVCDDGRTRYVDFFRKARGYVPFANYKDDVTESFEDDGPVYVASSVESLNNYCAGLGDACKKLRDGNMCSYRGYEVEFVDGEYNVYLLESIDESKENRPLYIIKDSHGNQLSAPNPDDEELWDRVASMEARGRRGLCVVVYTGKKESLKEWNEFSDDDVEDDLTHAAVYGGDSKYCKECGAVKKYDEDGFAYCPECCGELDESYWYNDPELRQKQDQLISELEADGFEETDSQSYGTKHWTFFRKRVDGKGVWKAIFVDTGSKESAIIDVTYGQVRGYEPLDSFDALRRDLGNKLLP